MLRAGTKTEKKKATPECTLLQFTMPILLPVLRRMYVVMFEYVISVVPRRSGDPNRAYDLKQYVSLLYYTFTVSSKTGQTLYSKLPVVPLATRTVVRINLRDLEERQAVAFFIRSIFITDGGFWWSGRSLLCRSLSFLGASRNYDEQCWVVPGNSIAFRWRSPEETPRTADDPETFPQRQRAREKLHSRSMTEECHCFVR